MDLDFSNLQGKGKLVQKIRVQKSTMASTEIKSMENEFWLDWAFTIHTCRQQKDTPK